MNGIRSFSLMLFLLFFPLLLEAQHVLDLQECLQIGLRNNYDLRIIRNEEQISANKPHAWQCGVSSDNWFEWGI